MSDGFALGGNERWEVTPPEVERQEAAWWDKYAWLENDYAWVHPPDVRRALRSHYFRGILKTIPKDGVVVDFGCGSGWLSILLCELGARRVIGVDNASAQIDLARKMAAEAGFDGKIEFIDSLDLQTLRTADAVIMHGVLHHLSGQEIDGLAQVLATHVSPETRIFILEPVLGEKRYMAWSLPYKLLQLSAGWRRQSAKERAIRRQLDGRADGPRHPGYGVSPKERPFRVGELERRLAPRLTVSPGKPVLFSSVRVAMELLLMAETKPKLARFLLRHGLGPYMLWERLSFWFAPKALWNGWVFCLFEARLPSSRR